MTAKEEVSLKYRKKWLGMLKDLCLKYIDKDQYAVFLFGSAVNDLIRANDVDIGFLGEKNLPDKVKYKINDEAAESIIPFKIDLVDFRNVNNEFKKEALSEIIVWNRPKSIIIN